jgi:hypothetical protein
MLAHGGSEATVSAQAGQFAGARSGHNEPLTRHGAVGGEGPAVLQDEATGASGEGSGDPFDGHEAGRAIGGQDLQHRRVAGRGEVADEGFTDRDPDQRRTGAVPLVDRFGLPIGDLDVCASEPRSANTTHPPSRARCFYSCRVDLEFSGDVWFWRGPSPFHFVTVPEDESAQLQATSALVTYGWGMIPVEVLIGSTRWTTSLFPKDGGYVVPLKDLVRTAEGIDVGDTVTLRLTVDV